MNFGVKITILYLGFVGLILTLVFMSYGHKIELVSKDYYAQELKYQDKIDAIKNANSLISSIDHKVEGKNITLTINPELLTKDFTGSINFFRPSDSSLDVNMAMSFNNNSQIITTDKLKHGSYKMQLTWKSDGKNYFKEEVIFIE